MSINSELSNKKILEIGSGTGFQLKILKEYSQKAVGIDIESSAYQEKVSDIIIYDGKHIPFPDLSFDVVFSSNVLEHIKDINSFHDEIKRVLKANGFCIHILPSHFWRFWTSLFYYLWVLLFSVKIVFDLFIKSLNSLFNGNKNIKKRSCNLCNRDYRHKTVSCIKAFRMAFVPQQHGERGNFITELFYFHPLWWKKNFTENGWHIESVFQTGLFYWGHDIFRFKIPIYYRQVLSKYFGSACYSYILKKESFSELAKQQ